MRTRLAAALAQAERAEDKFRRFFDFAPDATMTIAEDRSIVMANARAEQMFGYPAGELAGRPLPEILPAATGASDAWSSRRRWRASASLSAACRTTSTTC